MQFSKLKQYKIVECDNCVVICDRDMDVTNMPGIRPLAIADAGGLVNYLDRYLFERESGKTFAESHAAAVKSAQDAVVVIR